jgi:hypothetical protein
MRHALELTVRAVALAANKNKDLIAVGAFAAIGLTISLGFASAFSLWGGSSAIMLVNQFAGI